MYFVYANSTYLPRYIVGRISTSTDYIYQPNILYAILHVVEQRWR